MNDKMMGGYDSMMGIFRPKEPTSEDKVVELADKVTVLENAVIQLQTQINYLLTMAGNSADTVIPFDPPRIVKSFKYNDRTYNGTYYAIFKYKGGRVVVSENNSLETLHLAQNWTVNEGVVEYEKN